MAAPSASVVVVDDEESIGKYLVEVLSLRGYQCTVFQQSLLALAHFARSGPRPDLLITDIRMPGMDGLDLLRQVHRLAPSLPVILLSRSEERRVGKECRL